MAQLVKIRIHQTDMTSGLFLTSDNHSDSSVKTEVIQGGKDKHGVTIDMKGQY